VSITQKSAQKYGTKLNQNAAMLLICTTNTSEPNRENSADLLNKKYQFQVKLNWFPSENNSELMVF
jgi:hypothetical protein